MQNEMTGYGERATAEIHSAVDEEDMLRDYLCERPGLVLTVLELAGRYGEPVAAGRNGRERAGSCA